MGRMNLRMFAVSVLLVSAVIGMGLQFSEGVLQGTNQDFQNSDELNNIREDFASKSGNITDTGEDQTTGVVGIQTDFFFLPEVWNVITTVAGSVGDLPVLINSFVSLTGLNIPASVISLTGIVIIGVIFAVLSAARGWDV